MDEYEGVSIVNTANVEQKLQQRSSCVQNSMLMASIRYRIENIKQLDSESGLAISISFSDVKGTQLKENINRKSLIKSEISVADEFNVLGLIPHNANTMEISLNNYGNSQFTVIWEKALLNMI